MTDQPPERRHVGALDALERRRKYAARLPDGDLVAGRFRIICSLDAGPLGEVYEVHDRSLNCRLALVRLRPDVVAQAGGPDRVKSQIAIARRVVQENACRVFDFIEYRPNIGETEHPTVCVTIELLELDFPGPTTAVHSTPDLPPARWEQTLLRCLELDPGQYFLPLSDVDPSRVDERTKQGSDFGESTVSSGDPDAEEVRTLRAFLLGTLPEAKRVEIEDHLLRDQGFFEAVEAAEHELLDDYSRGRLSAPDTESVARAYGSSPIRAYRIRAAQVIHRAWTGSTEPADDPVMAPEKPVLTIAEYKQLKSMAAAVLKRARLDAPISAADLVNETHLRLSSTPAQWQNRNHFLAVAARVIRKVLVDHVKAHAGTMFGRSPDSVGGTLVLDEDQSLDFLKLDRALDHLARTDPEQCRIFELRYFAQLTEEQIAKTLDVSIRTVKRTILVSWAYILKLLAVEPL